MAKPVLHVGDVPVRVGQMHADRVPQDVNMAAVDGKVRCGRIGVEEPVDLSARERPVSMASAAEEVHRPVLRSFLEVARQQLFASRVKRIRAWQTVLPACNPDLPVPHVFEFEKTGFAPS